MKRALLVLTTLLCLATPAVAFAYNPLQTACQSGTLTQNSTACDSNGSSNPLTGPNGVLKRVSLIIATLAGIAAVIIIIIAGLQYITSSGDPQKAASARSAIIGAVVGLLIIAASETLIVFIVSKL